MRSKRQFSLRTLLGGIAVAGLLCGVLSVKLHQDRARRRAFRDLSGLGVASTIGPTCKFSWTRPVLTRRELHTFTEALEVLTRRHDLGLSAGLRVDIIDLRGSRVHPTSIEKIRRRFPSAEIRSSLVPSSGPSKTS